MVHQKQNVDKGHTPWTRPMGFNCHLKPSSAVMPKPVGYEIELVDRQCEMTALKRLHKQIPRS